MTKNKKNDLKPIYSKMEEKTIEEQIENLQKKIELEYKQNELDSIYCTRNRARSIMAGTAFGGVVEISMRSENNYMYAQIQPTEVVELIEQLAAGVGVEIAMRPKQNFASWRGWEEIIDQRIGWDRVAWKGAAAWQLGGRLLEENAQKKLGESKESIEKRLKAYTENEVPKPAPMPEEREDYEKEKLEKELEREKQIESTKLNRKRQRATKKENKE